MAEKKLYDSVPDLNVTNKSNFLFGVPGSTFPTAIS